MIVDIQYVEKKFDEYNTLIFSGVLPKIPIRISGSRTTLGKCEWRIRKLDEGKTEKYDFRLIFNNRIDFPESLVEDVIIHEMIHYFIGYKQIEDVTVHGPVFLHMMNSINEKYGRHITVSHKYSDEENEQSFDKRPLYHIIAIVVLKNGQCGVKVIPRILPRIVAYYNGIKKLPEFSSVEFYLSNNPFFNRFPNSGTITYKVIDESIIRNNLVNADRIECDGKTIKRAR